MTVAPLIAMKGTDVKSFAAIGMELDRRAHTYVNDVKPEHRHIGICVRTGDESPMPLEQSLERRMSELHTKRKVRENQVRAMGFIVSSNDALAEPDAIEFLRYSIDWLAARYGVENVLAAEIHLDEGTPHAHIWISPVIHDAATGFDRLCAKELFAPDKRRKNPQTGEWEVVAQGTMSRLQEDFYEQVSGRWGYERPLRREQRAEGYRSLEAYKVHVGTTRELRAQITQANERLESVRRREREAGERNGELERRVGELREQADQARAQPAGETVRESVKTLSGARGLGERESDARKRNQELRSRISALRERNQELGSRISALRSGIQRLERALGEPACRIKIGLAEQGRRARERFGNLKDRLATVAKDMVRSIPVKLPPTLFEPGEFFLSGMWDNQYTHVGNMDVPRAKALSAVLDAAGVGNAYKMVDSETARFEVDPHALARANAVLRAIPWAGGAQFVPDKGGKEVIHEAAAKRKAAIEAREEAEAERLCGDLSKNAAPLPDSWDDSRVATLSSPRDYDRPSAARDRARAVSQARTETRGYDRDARRGRIR